MRAHTLPPKEIYDVLHQFEELGGTLPETVDDWWKNETLLEQKEKSK